MIGRSAAMWRKQHLVKQCGYSIEHLAAVILILLPALTRAQTGTGNITGQVFCSDTQKPARFARVKVTGAFILNKTPNVDGSPFQKRSGGDQNEVHTLADGTFLLKDVPTGVYDLEITYPGYIQPIIWLGLSDLKDRPDIATVQSWLNLYTQVTVQAGRTANAVATISRGAELSGTVTYDDGSPAPDVVVEPMLGRRTPAGDAGSGTAATTNLLGLPSAMQAVTDSHGRFLIHDLVD